MTETTKKLDFNSLDFSKITADQPKVEITVDPIEGMWINDLSNEFVSVEMFLRWIESVLPG